MRMQLKKEVKHSVVYESKDDMAPRTSVYVMKRFLLSLGLPTGSGWPEEIELEVKLP